MKRLTWFAKALLTVVIGAISGAIALVAGVPDWAVVGMASAASVSLTIILAEIFA